jgi:hypothetical protein
MEFVTLKRGGSGGAVAVNALHVTDLRPAGSYTDIYFGEHFLTVEAAFPDVVRKFNEANRPLALQIRTWDPRQTGARASR